MKDKTPKGRGEGYSIEYEELWENFHERGFHSIGNPGNPVFVKQSGKTLFCYFNGREHVRNLSEKSWKRLEQRKGGEKDGI